MPWCRWPACYVKIPRIAGVRYCSDEHARAHQVSLIRIETVKATAAKPIWGITHCAYRDCAKRLPEETDFRFCGSLCREAHLSDLREEIRAIQAEEARRFREIDDRTRCSSCFHGKRQEASETGWECMDGLVLRCKPLGAALCYRRRDAAVSV